MERYKFIDIAKIIGIYLVILGHYMLYMKLDFKPGNMMNITHWIFMFHMPLFFILSGMLYRQRDLKTTWGKVNVQLLKPYLYMNVLCIVIGSVRAAIIGDLSFRIFLRNVLGIFTAGDFYGKAELSYSGALWFCFSLACIKLLFQKSLSMKYNIFNVVLLIIISGGVMRVGDKFPLKIDSALVGGLFFMFGYFFRDIILSINNMSKYKLLSVCAFSAITLYIAGSANVDFSHLRNISINAMWFGNNPLLFIVAGIAGTILVCSIAKLFEKTYSNTTRFIANGTIVILGFHHVVFFLFQGHITSYNPFVAAFISLVVMIICCGIIFLCKMFFPALLGR